MRFIIKYTFWDDTEGKEVPGTEEVYSSRGSENQKKLSVPTIKELI